MNYDLNWIGILALGGMFLIGFIALYKIAPCWVSGVCDTIGGPSLIMVWAIGLSIVTVAKVLPLSVTVSGGLALLALIWLVVGTIVAANRW